MKYLFNLLIPAVFFSCINQDAYSQTYELKGVVTDAKGKPLTDVSIQIKSSGKGTVTDVKGSFAITNLATGNYGITISSIGYESKTLKIFIPSGAIEIVLNERQQTLQDVNVQTKTQIQQLKEQPFAVNILDVKPLQGRALDIGQVLNETPGLRVRETGGTGSSYEFSINGLSGNQIKIFLDGVPFENFGSAYNLNSIPVNMIDRIEVYKGVVPVQLGGDALGGAVNIITKKGVGNFADVSYSYGSFDTHKATFNGQFHDDKTGFTVRGNSFYNYSKNNYTVRDVEVVIDDRFTTKDVKRFHDKYSSYLGQVEAGFTKTKWADAAMIGVNYSGIHQQIQSGLPYPAVGEATNREKNYLISASYAKNGFINKNLSINYYGMYNHNNSYSVDTSKNVYDWTGRIIYSRVLYGAELGDGGLFDYTLKEWQQRILLTYKLDANQTLNLNVLNSRVDQNTENLLYPRIETPNNIKKNIAGFSYQNSLMHDKWINILSTKYYNFNTGLVSVLSYDPDKGYEKEIIKGSKDYYGYNYATRYTINNNLLIKASYEKAYRLPEPIEIFGDGLLVLQNQALKPENSNNINLGVQYSVAVKNHLFNAEVSGFNRWIKDLIYALPLGSGAIYQNLGKAYVWGLEGEFKYQYKNKLNFLVNGTYQEILNNEKYQVLNPLKLNRLYRERLPNKPWLFANAEAGYTFRNVVQKGSRLTAFYGVNYVHSFDLNWATIAINGPQNIIPTQWLQYAGLIFFDNKEKFSVSIEGRNLGNVAAYDIFQLQKPGRAFSIKLRYFLSKTKGLINYQPAGVQ